MSGPVESEVARHALSEARMAAGQVAAATGSALGALRSFAEYTRATKLRQQAESTHEREVAEARAKAERVATRYREHIGAAVNELAPGACAVPFSSGGHLPIATDQLAVAEHVRLGSVRISTAEAGDIEVPLIVPLLNHGNLLIQGEAEAPELKDTIRNLVLRVLASTGPGQVILRGYDPSLRGFLAPFTPLRAISEDLFPSPQTRPEALEELFHQLTSDVQRIADLGHGQAASLGELRRETGQPIESYQLITLFDFPRGMTERSLDMLNDLLRTGPAHGISFVIHHDPTFREKNQTTTIFEHCAHTITVRGNRITWSAAPSLDAQADPPAQLRAILGDVSAAAQSMSAPRIPFGEVQPLDDLWAHSSADGISAAIGRAGHEVVEISLGKERDQRHNMLVTGAVGQGKSNFLKVFIHSLATRYSPNELELFLLDFKDGVTFFPLASTESAPEWLPHAKVIGVESDREYGVAVLEHLYAEFDRRARVIKPYGDQIAVYRNRVPDAHMPRIVAVIDEFHVLFEESDPITDRAVQLLERLAKRGRAYGIHLVLASQTISGITALMTKESGIYSQFPIRIALKNSTSESRAVLDNDNIEAARLRFRGEAVVNLDFGQADSNRRAVIAVADDEELAAVQHQCWLNRSADARPPAVFDGGLAATLLTLVPQLRELRARARDYTFVRSGLLGFPIGLTQFPIGVPLPASPGRHLAVVGAGNRAAPLGIPAPAEPNLAIGVLQAVAFSLAVQHPASDAEFTILSYLTDAEATESGMPYLQDLLKQLGFNSRLLQHAEATDELRALAEQIEQRRADQGRSAHYVLGFAIDRAGALNRQDAMFHTPVSDLQSILRDGPAHDMHLLGWWSSLGMLKAHLGFDPTTAMDAILALRLDQRDVTDLMGHTASWSARENRGLLFDRTQLTAPVTIVPTAPLDRDTYDALSRMEWAS